MHFQNNDYMPHVWKLYTGEKTETRRLVKSSFITDKIVKPNVKKIEVRAVNFNKPLFKMSVGDILIQNLCDITEEEAKNEGFESIDDFLRGFGIIYQHRIPRYLKEAHKNEPFIYSVIPMLKEWDPIVIVYKDLKLIKGSETEEFKQLLKLNKIRKGGRFHAKKNGLDSNGKDRKAPEKNS